MFESAAGRITNQQAGLSKIQAQLSSGQRILAPSDDPLGAAKALDVSQGRAVDAQYTDNRTNAKTALTQQDGALDSVTTLLQDVRAQVLAAGSGTLDEASRGFIATVLRSRLDALTGLANSRESIGNYMFAGLKDSTQPFNNTGATVSYSGADSIGGWWVRWRFDV
jgi:flagellar hook-associated protein 3 FlgL